MKERERFALLRITGKYGGSVVVELNDSYAPGIPDVKGQLLVHNDFVSGVHDTYVEPRDLADWAHVLDEVLPGAGTVGPCDGSATACPDGKWTSGPALEGPWTPSTAPARMASTASTTKAPVPNTARATARHLRPAGCLR
ncbi:MULTISPECIES: DUF5959 family protein [unclassified Streptomyces]|uniref:DUF5959 family protein n=1 Tax=unclassified Streptomyces TaxID=2593676 RepID=UPI0034499077